MSLALSDRSELLALARQSIESGLAAMRWVPMSPVELTPALLEHRGNFVTVRIRQQLRGGCGNLLANCSLGESVWRNAWAAAFADPRFPALESDEWPGAEIHISVLTPLEALVVADEQDLLDKLRPNIDGLVFERDDTRATFLPEVWGHIPEPMDFVYHLKQKAGWPASSWSPHIKVWRFTALSFAESNASALQTTEA